VPAHELRQWEDWEDSSLETPSVVEQRSWGVDLSSLFFEQSDVILVVDNTVDSLRYMRAIFEPVCKVIEARGAKEALELCRASPPNLVICDLVMPYEGGDVVLAGLRNGTREMAMVPFIMLTTHDDTRPENALTADDYLSKPFNARDLLSRGHMQLQLGKRRRDIEDRFEERTSELRIMSENLPMGIFRARPEDGSITYCNAAWHEQSGYPVDGDFTDWFTYVDPTDLEPMAKGWFEFLADPDQLEYQFNGRWKNGKSGELR
jgi:CheY-like chemotaxis protein